MRPPRVRGGIDALQGHGAEIADKAVDMAGGS